MDAIKTNEKLGSFKKGLKKLGSILLKILLEIAIVAIVVFALVAIYKILEFLFVAAILLIAWIGVVPKRWR